MKIICTSQSIDASQNITPQNVSKRRLTNLLYKKIMPVVSGLFSDESWQPINKIWNILNELNLDWVIRDSYYGTQHHDKTFPPERKTWNFEINFTNNRGKADKIYGTVVAAGAGNIEDPLERYDVTVTMANSNEHIKVSGWKDQLPGGMADKKKPEDFDAEQLGKGTRVEMEHTNDPEIAKEIAMDHLEESKDYKEKSVGKYYDLLEQMERIIERKKHQ